MTSLSLHVVALLVLAGSLLAPGDHKRSVQVGELTRSYVVHVPPNRDAAKPSPVVLVLHGASMNGRMMEHYCGLDQKGDQAGFVVVYPDGAGPGNMMRTWNSGSFGQWVAKQQADDVAFVAKLLDDLAGLVAVDRKRVYATGLSNGGMMCYRLAAELSDRIAAIAPVAGTMAAGDYRPKRPVPVLHFHGTVDPLVPFNGPNGSMSELLTFRSVGDTIRCCAKANGCPEEPAATATLPDTANDGTTILRKDYGPGKEGSEVVLYVITGGGHTWPGRQGAPAFVGKSTENISANELMWSFFEKHPLP